jgi:hypothetical protein
MCGVNVPDIMSSKAAVNHSHFLRVVLVHETKFAIQRDGRRVTLAPLMKCWYGFISTDFGGGDYDDVIAALNNHWATDGQRRKFPASENGIQPCSSNFYAFRIPFIKII